MKNQVQKTKALKEQINSDLTALIDLTIDQAQSTVGFMGLDEWITLKNPLSTHKKESEIYEYCRLKDDNNEFEEPINFKYGLFEFSLSPLQSITLSRKISNAIGSGLSVQPTKNKASELDQNGKKLQGYIAELREDYNGEKYWSYKDKERAKKDVIEAYNDAKPNDLIRLCWKYIIQPQKIEGVNVPYSVEPKAVFTPYEVKQVA